jgi:hypothetical protein
MAVTLDQLFERAEGKRSHQHIDIRPLVHLKSSCGVDGAVLVISERAHLTL